MFLMTAAISVCVGSAFINIDFRGFFLIFLYLCIKILLFCTTLLILHKRFFSKGDNIKESSLKTHAKKNQVSRICSVYTSFLYCYYFLSQPKAIAMQCPLIHTSILSLQAIFLTCVLNIKRKNSKNLSFYSRACLRMCSMFPVTALAANISKVSATLQHYHTAG